MAFNNTPGIGYGARLLPSKVSLSPMVREFDVLQGDVMEGVFTLDVGRISVNPDHDTIKVPLDFWRKEMGQLASEVRTHDG